MDNATLAKLENLVFEAKKKPAAAANTTADIIGVLVGLKPAMVGYFDFDEYHNFPVEEFIELLEKINLKVLFFKRSRIGLNDSKWEEQIYISSSFELAVKTHNAFEELWNTMDDHGQIFDFQKWTNATREIGRLLGYPETATEYFISHRNTNDENRRKILARNRYYLHSPEHEEEEYQSYDFKLNQAVAELAPKTAEIFTSDKNKRWL